jgi:hypothetical protein
LRSWRDRLLSRFPPDLARIWVVTDPDGLLTEEGIAASLRERGFDLVDFDDPMAFRYTYETEWRNIFGAEDVHGRMLIVRIEGSDTRVVPFDVWRSARRETLGVDLLFPTLDAGVVASLDREALDALDAVPDLADYPHLGENGTRDLALRVVYGIWLADLRGPRMAGLRCWSWMVWP